MARTKHLGSSTATLGAVRIDVVPRILLWTLLLVAGVWLAFQLSKVLMVITVALVLVGTLDPLVAWLEGRGLRRGRALALVMVAMTLAVGGGLLLTVPPLLMQLVDVIDRAPAARDRLVAVLRDQAWAGPFVKTLESVPLDHVVVDAGHAVLGYASALFSIVGYGISTVFLAIYLLVDPARSKGILYAILPRQHHMTLARIILELKVIVGGYMRGQLLTSVAMSLFVFAILTSYQVDNALAIALFAGVTDIIPFVGGYVASAPVVVAVAMSGASSAMIAVVIALMVVYQEFESRILVPRVYGRVLRLPPAMVLVALLVGGTLLGIIGALLALPIAAGLQMLVRELRFDLPGEAPATASERMQDAYVENLYEGLAKGATAAGAGAIADGLAENIKEAENSRVPPPTTNDELPPTPPTPPLPAIPPLP